MKLLNLIITWFKKRKKEKPVLSQAKKVYVYVNGTKVTWYSSITKCGSALRLSRPMVKRVIQNGTVLDNGFQLKFH
jgi:hypothetical protein